MPRKGIVAPGLEWASIPDLGYLDPKTVPAFLRVLPGWLVLKPRPASTPPHGPVGLSFDAYDPRSGLHAALPFGVLSSYADAVEAFRAGGWYGIAFVPHRPRLALSNVRALPGPRMDGYDTPYQIAFSCTAEHGIVFHAEILQTWKGLTP